MNLKNFYLTLALFLLSGAVLAETVYLKDGSKVVGTIMQSDENLVKIKTDMGELTIPKDKIKRISYTEEEEEGRGNINIQIQQQQQQQQQQAVSAPTEGEKPGTPGRSRNSLSIGPGFSKAKVGEEEFNPGFVFQWDSGRIVNKYVDFNGTLGVSYFSKEVSSEIQLNLWQIPLEVGVRIYPFVTLDPFKEGEETKVHILAGSKDSWSFCPYVGAGIGLLIGIVGVENTAISESNSDGGLGFDLYFSAGLDLNLGQNFSLFTELKFQGNPGESTFKADDGSKYKVDMGTFLWKFGIRI